MIIETEKEKIFRDIKSKALINKDIGAYNTHKLQKAQLNRISVLEKQMIDIQNKLETILSIIGK